MTDPILVERRGSALWITINRPDRRNAINNSVITGIQAGLERARSEKGVRVVVLTGAGEKAFCAGGDLQQGTSVFDDDPVEPTTDFGRLARFGREMQIPMVGRINGACVAGGTGLMALCDIVVAADHAKFGLPEARVGVFPFQVHVYFRKLILPRHVAELALLGEYVDAHRAREMGLINYVVPAEELDAKVAWVCEKLALASPAAIRRGKYAMTAMQDMAFHEALSFAEGQIMLTAASDDAAEGLAAFNEKRRPRWQEES
ncbi:enoyl-CoA hydratase [Nitratireductor aestuarii]|uniref:Enoyl-CoA hydratase n=1 Tax=Nitratireductor aestuarii TaxID=1735103 RepID=A0A916W8Y5_9HYPH|nr:enoyl-CoA hydratase-related protein [Nitratireductor aestuarii]GGA76842.1 enoyl-CoA hydratase [Nitratireductor aestuarii]